ncbi:uncharacterized protein LOC131941190 [Physella acuta]|uniref:uncharacterized protein LOC131941190 n=1 Tax=Physella acuta TaxID=109671 RepID=UPI0027DBC0F1|nr:uncharacterized protein LOC131941190 [Physella acuta]
MASQGWENIPPHVLLSIFQYSSLNTVGVSAQVCHTWKDVTADKSLWRNLSLELDESKLAESARRAMVLTKKCAGTIRSLRVSCKGCSYNMRTTFSTLKDVMRIIWGAQLRVFELEWVYPDIPKTTAIKSFASFLKKFLKDQRSLEKFSFRHSNIEPKHVTTFLQVLAKSSGETIKYISLDHFFSDFDEYFSLGPTYEFNTALTKFTNLESLEIKYLCEELLQDLGRSLGTNFKHLSITIDQLEEDIPDTAWRLLTQFCPNLVVSLKLPSDTPSDTPYVILSPSLPLVGITARFNGQSKTGDQFSLANIAALYQQTLEDLHIGHFKEWQLTEDFLGQLESFQKLRTFSMSMTATTTQNIKFLKVFCEMLKRKNTLREVSLNFGDRRTIGPRVLKEIDNLKEDLKEFVDRGLVLNFNLPTADPLMMELNKRDTI